MKKNRNRILRIAEKYGARNLRVFGSVARGEESFYSDIDLLVDMEPGTGLFSHARLILELQKLLGTQVDVATANSLRPRLRSRILNEAVPL